LITNELYKQTHDYINSSYDEFKQTKDIISDIEVYNFINEIHSSNDSIEKDSLKFQKLMCFSIPHSESLIKLIDELPDSIVNSDNKIHLQIIKY
jgi:hypothetical protein